MGMGMEKGVGACQVVSRDLRKVASDVCTISRCDTPRFNAYYPDFAYRVDVKKKCLQVLSVVGPSKFVQGTQVEGASCFNRLKAEGDARCIEEYGQRLGYVYSNSPSSTIFFTAIFECFCGENVKWMNPLPFDSGAEDLVMSLARDARDWIEYFQRNISKLRRDSTKHTKLSLVLQLDVINCEAWSGRVKMPLDLRFAYDCSGRESQGALKRRKGVRYRADRGKWIAEFNPPGKKNHKISLGEYDSAVEAARAADVGMFCFGSKGGYNFDDSPSFLEQIPRPVTDDKEAVRKCARDFVKMIAKPSTSSRSDNGAPTSCTISVISEGVIPSSLQHSPSASFSNYRALPEPASEYLPLCDSDSSSAPSFHLEDVTEYISVREAWEQFDQRFSQVLASEASEQIAYSEENQFRNDDFCRTGDSLVTQNASINRAVSDDLFQYFISCNPAFNVEVERCSIQQLGRV